MAIGQNGTGIGIRLLNDRCRGIAAKLVDDRPDLVADVLDRNVHVLFKNEIDVDVRVALIGIRAQFVDAFDRIDGCFDGKRERRFDFFGAGTGKLDAYVDVGLLGSWHQVDAKAPIREDPQRHERHRHHQCEYRAANADVRYLHSLPPKPRRAPPLLRRCPSWPLRGLVLRRRRLVRYASAS